jgi:capsular polysaccharide biosynthesis protein
MTTQESISNVGNLTVTRTTGTYTLLDLLVVIVDNLRLLVIGPIFIGLIVFLGASLMPKTYESTAILKSESLTVGSINSASVLDPIVISLGYTPKLNLDDARLKLKKQIQINVDTKDKLLSLTAQGETPQAAQALTQAILHQIYANSQPRDTEKLRLQKQLEQAQEREKKTNQTIQFLEENLRNKGGTGAKEFIQGYAQLIRIVQEAQLAQADIQLKLNGIDSSSLVQDPVLPSKEVTPNRDLLTILSILSGFFSMIFLVFIRHSVRENNKNEEYIRKLEAIKISLRNF